MRVRKLLILCALLLAAGCDLVPTAGGPQINVASRAQGLFNGWLRYESAGDRFSIDAPTTWVRMEVSAEGVQAAINLLKGSSPDLAKYLDNSGLRLQMSGMASQGVRLILYDSGSDVAATGFATNLNVVRTDVPPGMGLDEVVSKNVAEVQRALAANLTSTIDRELANVCGKEARRISYMYSLTLPYGRYLEALVRQYLLLHAGSQYVLTLITTSGEWGTRAAGLESIARTFRCY